MAPAPVGGWFMSQYTEVDACVNSNTNIEVTFCSSDVALATKPLTQYNILYSYTKVN